MCLVTKSSPILCDPMDCRLPGLCPWESSRQEYWSGLPCPPQGIFLNQGLNLGLPDCRQILYHLSCDYVAVIATGLVETLLLTRGISRASQVALMVKNLSANAGEEIIRDTGLIPELGRSPGGGNGNHSNILSWRIPWTEEPSEL